MLHARSSDALDPSSLEGRSDLRVLFVVSSETVRLQTAIPHSRIYKPGNVNSVNTWT